MSAFSPYFLINSALLLYPLIIVTPSINSLHLLIIGLTDICTILLSSTEDLLYLLNDFTIKLSPKIINTTTKGDINDTNIRAPIN